MSMSSPEAETATTPPVARPSVGRRRSPIWEHFQVAENEHGKRVAECLFCKRKMKSQPDRMENHLIKLCAKVDDETRGQWLLARANRTAAAPAPEQSREYADAPFPAVEHKHECDNSAAAMPAADVPSNAADAPVTVGAVVAAQDSSVRAQKQTEAPRIESVEDTNAFIATTATSSPVGSKTRKSPPSARSSATKKPKLATATAGDALEQQSHVSGSSTPALSEAAPCSCSCSAEVQRRRLEFEERKGVLELEGMRYDNDMKRIKLAEENMLARKRLQDAGVPYADIELMLPLQR